MQNKRIDCKRIEKQEAEIARLKKVRALPWCTAPLPSHSVGLSSSGTAQVQGEGGIDSAAWWGKARPHTEKHMWWNHLRKMCLATVSMPRYTNYCHLVAEIHLLIIYHNTIEQWKSKFAKIFEAIMYIWKCRENILTYWFHHLKEIWRFLKSIWVTLLFFWKTLRWVKYSIFEELTKKLLLCSFYFWKYLSSSQ